MEHNIALIIWGEMGVALLLLINLVKRYKTPTLQRPDKTAFFLEHLVYIILCGVTIYFLNEGESFKDIMGLKQGELKEVYCFFSVGLSISSLSKNLLGAAL